MAEIFNRDVVGQSHSCSGRGILVTDADDIRLLTPNGQRTFKLLRTAAAAERTFVYELPPKSKLIVPAGATFESEQFGEFERLEFRLMSETV